MDDLCNWAIAKGGRNPGEVSVASFDGMRGIGAGTAIEKGKVVVAVPFARGFSRAACESLGSAARVLGARDDLAEDDVIALLLVAERARGRESPRWRHIESLPETYPTHPINWSDDEVRELQGANLFYVMLRLRQQIAEDYALLVANLFAKHPAEFPLETFSQEAYVWGLCCVWSRAMDLEVEGRRQRVIMPFLDMFNTVTGDADAKPCHYYDPATKCVTILARDGCAVGEQVLISYAATSNARLLRLYGFVVEENPFEFVEMYTTMSPEAENFAAKVQLLVGGGVTELDAPHKLTSSDPLPASLLASIRIQRLTEGELAGGAKAFAGPVNAANEAATLAALGEGVQAMLASYPTKLGEDLTALKKAGPARDLGDPRTLALILRIEEKKILLRAQVAVSRARKGL